MLYTDLVEFEWDDVKSESNLRKHGVRFAEAITIWLDESAREIHDPDHSGSEDRWIRIGVSQLSRLLVVVYCERRNEARVRIISARKATRNEQEQYAARTRQ